MSSPTTSAPGRRRPSMLTPYVEDCVTALLVTRDHAGRVETVDLLTHPDGVEVLTHVLGERPRTADDDVAPTSGDGDVTCSDRFSRREREVLELVTEGCSNQEIADRLHLSINSVKSHIRTTYRKIGVTRRAEAVRWGLIHGVGLDYESGGGRLRGTRRDVGVRAS